MAIEPLPPKHKAGVGVAVTTIGAGCVSVTLAATLSHVFASLTLIE